MFSHSSHLKSASPSRLLALLILLLFSPSCHAQNTRSGVAITQRYWDCCKNDCSWRERASVNQPVATCDVDGNQLDDFNLMSGCSDGPSYACSDQSPWAVNDTFSYGYAGVFLMGRASDSWCCACFELTFTTGSVAGKRMIVQAHNSGFDLLTANKFALAIPGGNTSFAGACARQFGVSDDVFGRQDQGVDSIEDCDALPELHRAGCRWRFEWFEDAPGPDANYTRVRCPAELTNRSGCIRTDEDSIDEPGAAPAITANSLSALTVSILLFLGFGTIILTAL